MRKDSEFNPEELLRWIKDQAAFGPRRPGSPGGLANEQYLFEKLSNFGLSNVRREPTDVQYWEAQKTSLTVGNDPIESFGIPHTCLTSAGGVQAPLIYASANSLIPRPEWRGRLVVAEIEFPVINTSLLLKLALGAHDPDDSLGKVNHPATWIRLGWHLYRLAAKSGATGFIGILKNQPGGTCEMYAPYGFKEKDILDKPIPGVWVGKQSSTKLIALAKANASAHLILAGSTQKVTTCNIVGELPGATDETIVLSSHHDSPFTSPVEDASGVAVVLGLAQAFMQRPKPRRRIVVLLSAGHFYGSIGTRSFIAQHRHDIVSKTVLEISIEHIALEAIENAEGKLVPSGMSEAVGLFAPFSKKVRGLLLAGLSRHEINRTLILPPEGPLGEYPPTDGGDWYEAGIPVINYISNPVYLLTNDDAMHWVDQKRMVAAARFFSDLLTQLDAMSTAEIAARDFPLQKIMLKVLRICLKAKTTWFGLKPIH